MSMRSTPFVSALAAVAFVLNGAVSALAQRPGESVMGRVVKVEWPYVYVDWNGHTVQQKLHGRTRIVFHRGAECFPNPDIGDLQPGMTARFDYQPQGELERIHVQEVPSETCRALKERNGNANPGQRSNAPPPPSTNHGSDRRELKVRILD